MGWIVAAIYLNILNVGSMWGVVEILKRRPDLMRWVPVGLALDLALAAVVGFMALRSLP